MSPLPFTVEASRFMPVGTIAWMRRRDVLGWVTKERRDFWRMFGFVTVAPAGCTGIMVSVAEYEEIRAATHRASRDGGGS